MYVQLYVTVQMAVAGGSAASRARGNFQAERGGAADAGTAQGRWSGAAPRSVQARGAMPALGEAEGIRASYQFYNIPSAAEIREPLTLD